MAEHFEDRHRELREAADADGDLGWDQLVNASDSAMTAFRERTGPLVDDLVAAARLAQFCTGRIEADEPTCFEANLPREESCNGCWLKRQIAALDEACHG